MLALLLSDGACAAGTCYHTSDWLDCIRFWRRQENYIPKGHCLGIFVIFWKRKRASLLCCSAELTDTLVVNKCSHWRRCWKAKRVVEKQYGKPAIGAGIQPPDAGYSAAVQVVLNWSELLSDNLNDYCRVSRKSWTSSCRHGVSWASKSQVEGEAAPF